jgi:RNA polymerase sigma factor (sigma-70 family)
MDDGRAPVDWAAVWEQHGEAMLHVARSQLRGRVADGYTDEDVVGDVLAGQIKNPAGYQEADDKRAYLAGAVRNRCRSKLKRGRRQVVHEADEIDALADRHRPDIDPVGDRATDAALASAIAACLDRLTENQQIAIRRRVMNEERSIDIAADLGRKPAVVSQHVNAALTKLRKDLTFMALTTWDHDVEQVQR